MQPWVGPFLENLRACGIHAKAARRVGVSYSAVMALKANNADFAHACDEALEEAVDNAEAEAWRRGVEGFEEPVIHQGQLTPVWAVDEDGERIMQRYDTGDVHPKDHPKAGEPIYGLRPVQAKDANGNPQWLTIRKHSDALLALVLKGRRKKVFAERTEITGADGGAVNIDDTARAARVAALMSLAQQRKAADNEDLV